MFIHNNSQFQHMISFKHLDFTHTKPKIILIKCLYSLGQKIVDKFIKLSKIGFSMECFITDFLQFFWHKCQNVHFK